MTAPLTLDARIEGDGDRPATVASVRDCRRDGRVSRSAHGLRFRAAGGAGDVTVGDSVKVRLELSLLRERVS